jgi:hypothetical protein
MQSAGLVGKVFINEGESTDEKYDGYLHIEKMTGSVDQLANPWLLSRLLSHRKY